MSSTLPTLSRRSLLGLTLTASVSSAAFAQAPGSTEIPPPPPAVDGAAAPNLAAEVAALRARLDDVDQRARIAERKTELADEENAKRLKEGAVVNADFGGFQLKSADGAYALAFRGLLMADGRFLLDDKALELKDTFLASRVRPSFYGAVGKIAELNFLPDFGNGSVTILDAYGELKPFPWLRFRAGKAKSPVGIERLQGDAAVVFVERALPTQLTPNRDIGFSVWGDIAGGIVSYTLGVVNGAIDGQNLDADTNFAKDFVGRLAFTPFKTDPYSLFSRLSFGVGATTGNHRATASVLTTAKDGTVSVKTASAPNLSSYRTTGAQTVFSYIAGKDLDPASAVLGQGRASRLSPYLTYYVGGFGFIGELTYSKNHVVKGTSEADLTHRAYQLFASYVFGGTAGYEGTKVATPFDPSQGNWGAVEIAARYHELHLDADTFPTYADPTVSVKVARAAGGQVSWYWNRSIKLAAAYEQTWFDGGAAAGADRHTEKLLQTRVQLLY